MTQHGQYDMIGKSEPMQKVYRFIDQISTMPQRYNLPIILYGERGTGKELVAKAIHNYGPRKTGSFVAFNCTAVTETIAEAELFGYKQGSFTGAGKDRKGLFQAANEGTLYIDEIVNMPLSMQSKLLRALQEKKVRPVGSQQEESYDAQILVSSNKLIKAAIDKREFLPDLYDRLNVAQINIPALRERGEDIILLANYFAEKYGTLLGRHKYNFSEDANRFMKLYSWPGNVRQLESVIQGIIGLRTDNNRIIVSYELEERLEKIPAISGITIPLKSREEDIQYILDGTSLPDHIRNIERDICVKLLQRNNGNVMKTAKILGIARTTLIMRLRKWRVS